MRFKTALRTDERVRFMEEIVSGVQVIKLYAWEKPYARLIAKCRHLELQMVLKNGYVRAFFLTMNIFSTRIAVFATVLSFVLLYRSENMTSSNMFMATYLFNMITVAMTIDFVNGVSEMGEAYMALKRLQTFFEFDEKLGSVKANEPKTEDVSESQHIAISMKNISAEWTNLNEQTATTSTDENQSKNHVEADHTSFKLQNINLEVPKGKLIFVVGSVGSGKSTLLQILLKELPTSSGSMSVNGSISYVSQESWIFTSTVRQNITFGQSMDRARYDEVIKCTAMTRDLQLFSDGDMTLVGERGAGLSGGQKARIK